MIEKANVVVKMNTVNKSEVALVVMAVSVLLYLSFSLLSLVDSMPDLDNREYTNDNDDPSQLIVGVTKTVSKLPPSRPGPGVYISYATRTWASRGKIKVSFVGCIKRVMSRY